jgi:leucyl aminopeptidase
MSNEVKVIFANDPIVSENATVKQFVANQKAGHSSVLIEETHYIVVKECKEKDATLEKVRATAGNIARDVSDQ